VGADTIAPVEILSQKPEENMRKSWKIPALLCVWTCTAVTFVSTNARADTHVIKGTQDVTWESEGQSSTTNGVPLEVKVKKGDTIDIQIPAGDIPHGFVTISKRGDADPTPAPNKDLVQACGETKAKAVLRETECTATPSVFGKQFTSPPSTLKLIVQDNFQADVNFWCVVHKKRMWGTLQLKP
jgi:hypothetical protein